jgi:prephenate dehydrogenase
MVAKFLGKLRVITLHPWQGQLAKSAKSKRVIFTEIEQQRDSERIEEINARLSKIARSYY